MSTSLDLEKTAKLARICIAPEQVAVTQSALEKIIKFEERMNAVDTSQTVALAHPFDLTQPLRPDVCTENELQLSDLELIAPEFIKGLFVVPPVIE